ncbi:hypothetical protein BN844_0883 [Pseudomonas sp. SHC52]|nr:hypothetical protein BN844_0883 [Pseudomonas sp. SHC52]
MRFIEDINPLATGFYARHGNTLPQKKRPEPVGAFFSVRSVGYQ